MDHEQLLDAVGEKIDAQTRAITELREEVSRKVGAVRDSVDALSGELADVAQRTRDLERSVDGIDDTQPGLKVELKALEARQRGDEQLERDRVNNRRWLKWLAGALAAAVTAVGLPALGWYGARVEATRDQVQTSDHEIDLVKHRVERLEAEPDERLDAILEALERNDT